MNQAVVVAHLLTVVVVGRSLRRCLKLQRLKTITVNVVLSHVGFLRNGAAVIAFRLKGSVCVCWSVTVSQSVSQSVSHVFSSSHNRFLVNSLSSSSGSCCFRPCCSEPESPSITCNHRGHSHSGSMNLDELTENNFTTLAHKVCACYGGVIFLSMQTPRLRESAPTFLLLTISFYSAHYFLNQPHFPRIAIPRCQHRTFSKVR